MTEQPDDVRRRPRFTPPGARDRVNERADGDAAPLTGPAGRVVQARLAAASGGSSSDVPALEAEPEVAATVFGAHLETARAFVRDLDTFGAELGLVGPDERERLWSRHILNSAIIAPLLRGTVADIGSGGGFPGIPCAIVRPDLEFTLIEPMERRCVWLRDESERLGLQNVTVLRARAEDVDGSTRFDTVTARAVAALAKLIPWTAPLLAEGGQLVLQKGARAEDEIVRAAKAIRRFGLEDVRVAVLGEDLGLEATRVVIANRP